MVEKDSYHWLQSVGGQTKNQTMLWWWWCYYSVIVVFFSLPYISGFGPECSVHRLPWGWRNLHSVWKPTQTRLRPDKNFSELDKIRLILVSTKQPWTKDFQIWFQNTWDLSTWWEVLKVNHLMWIKSRGCIVEWCTFQSIFEDASGHRTYGRAILWMHLAYEYLCKYIIQVHPYG